LDDLPVDLSSDDVDVHRPQPAELLAAAATARAGLVDLGATPADAPPADVDTAVQQLAAMIRETAGTDLRAARKARGRGRR
ncbi:hypothetical protein, partial [Nocardioides pelophilus]|uniref:hypothetical protein n=1 Tax=Nocardioides pelophilus TaxID=2172019 RepID=UPI0016015303